MNLSRNAFSLPQQLAAICVAAMALALSFRVAPVSLTKFVLVVLVLMGLFWPGARRLLRFDPDAGPQALAWVTAFALTTLGLSWLWTPVDAEAASSAWLKSSKLLLPLLLVIALCTTQQAKRAWFALFAGQSLVVALTWFIVLFGRPDWLGAPHISNMPTGAPAVFNTYLDQALMNGITAFMAWHLRATFTPKWAKPALVTLAIAALLTCFLLPGRSGHVVALVLLGLSAWLELPKRLKLLALVLPPLALAMVFVASPRSLERVQLAVTEAKQFNTGGLVNSSIGERLHYWTVSAELIAQKPVFGHGLGSWNSAYLGQLKGRPAPAHSAGIRNPHQEYLLWGVQLGVAGIALLLAWFAAAAAASRGFTKNTQRATLCAVLACMVVCLFNAAIYDALIGDYLMVVIGLCLALGITQQREAGG